MRPPRPTSPAPATETGCVRCGSEIRGRRAAVPGPSGQSWLGYTIHSSTSDCARHMGGIRSTYIDGMYAASMLGGRNEVEQWHVDSETWRRW